MAQGEEPRFEGKTVAEVRAILATGNFDVHRWGREAKAFVEDAERNEAAESAARQEGREDRNLAIANESNELARRANRSANLANVIALIALLVAIVAILRGQ